MYSEEQDLTSYLEESTTTLATEVTKQTQRKDANFHSFVNVVVESSVFNWFIMGTIFLNAITIAMETTSLSEKIPMFLMAVDNIFLGIYLMEFVMKIYAEPLGYWKNYYNLFDFSVLMISSVQSILTALNFGQTGLMVLKVIRALRTLRTLRSISFIRGLQVLVNALIQTFKSSVFYLLLLLMILMFLFAIIGYYFFGYEEDGDKRNWGNFGQCLLSLFIFVTADGWTDLQEQLSFHGFKGSEIFTMVFLFLGHFIFTNLFIGVIIMNIHSATKEFEDRQHAEKEIFLQTKKEAMISKQHEDVIEMLENQKANNFANFEEMTKEFQKSLRHDDFTYTTDLCTTVQWMETLIASLQHLESSKYRCQQVHFEIAEVLAELKEYQLSVEVDKEDEDANKYFD